MSEPGPSPVLTMDILLARHRKELRDLQSQITQKKKNATKKTRKGVNSECESLERNMTEKHEREVRELGGGGNEGPKVEDGESKGEKAEEEIEEEPPINGLGPLTSTTTIPATDPSPIPPPSPAPAANPRKPKPNRAKARLARRAAEIEASSAAAASEALSLPDLRAAELSTLRARFQTLNLKEQEIPPDGHCLYSAFADQLDNLEIPLQSSEQEEEATKPDPKQAYKLTRSTCASYISAHKDDFSPFLEEDIDTYTHKVAHTAEWGGQAEVLALAKAYDVVANVVQAQGRVERMNEEESSRVDGSKVKRKEVWLAYYRHSFGLGEHYNSLRPVGK